MAKIKIVKGDIFNPKKPVDMIIYRSKATIEPTFINSKYQNARYCFVLPGYELNDDNALEFLDCYKKPIKRARELKMRTIAIEAVDMNDEELTIAFASELAERLKEATTLYDIEVSIICKNKEIRDLYELAIFGELSSEKVIMTDQLEGNEVIVIPTKYKASKWDKFYKPIKKEEPGFIFWKSGFGAKIKLGEFLLLNGHNFATFYYLINFDSNGVKSDLYNNSVIHAIKSVMSSVDFMRCHSITFPILRFIKKEDENKLLIEKLLEEITDFIEDREINVKLYCPDPELWDFVQSWFAAQERK